MKASFINPINHRYYVMLVSENLFGETEIMVSRGSSHRPKSIIRYIVHSSVYETMREFYKLACLRLKHGYVEKA
jgi:hypothetical protein